MVFVLTYLFIRVTIDFFANLSDITAQGVAAYGILNGTGERNFKVLFAGNQ
ncbi:unnamed protein product, partial [marine sediment metagenome]